MIVDQRNLSSDEKAAIDTHIQNCIDEHVERYKGDRLALYNASIGLEKVARLFPYTYFQGSEAFTHFNLTWLFILLTASVIMILLAWWRFERRDVRLSGEGTVHWQIPFRFKGKHT